MRNPLLILFVLVGCFAVSQTNDLRIALSTAECVADSLRSGDCDRVVLDSLICDFFYDRFNVNDAIENNDVNKVPSDVYVWLELKMAQPIQNTRLNILNDTVYIIGTYAFVEGSSSVISWAKSRQELYTQVYTFASEWNGVAKISSITRNKSNGNLFIKSLYLDERNGLLVPPLGLHPELDRLNAHRWWYYCLRIIIKDGEILDIIGKHY